MPNRSASDALSSPELLDLADRLHSAAIRLLRRLRGEDRATGLSGPRASALSVIVFGGPQTLTQLAAAEQVRAPTMTRMVQGMVRDGLVRRTPDAADRRIVRIIATPKGKALLVRARERRVQRLARALHTLQHQETKTLADGTALIQRVTEVLAE